MSSAEAAKNEMPGTDCGVDDFLIEEDRARHRHSTALGIPHEYQENAGSHGWGYWDAHIQKTLGFFKRVLKLGQEDPAGERG